jgi:hypothetical protein
VQQPLSAKAMQRRTTFESFIKRTTKADEARASKEYDGMLATSAATRMTVKSVRQLQTLIATEIGDKAPEVVFTLAERWTADLQHQRQRRARACRAALPPLRLSRA